MFLVPLIFNMLFSSRRLQKKNKSDSTGDSIPDSNLHVSSAFRMFRMCSKLFLQNQPGPTMSNLFDFFESSIESRLSTFVFFPECVFVFQFYGDLVVCSLLDYFVLFWLGISTSLCILNYNFKKVPQTEDSQYRRNGVIRKHLNNQKTPVPQSRVT